MEDGEEYSIKFPEDLKKQNSKKKNQKHDKIFKQLFKRKEEAVIFINKHLKLEGRKKELKAEQLEECNTEFIKENMEKLQSDILFRIKGTMSYILIEHQSTVDYKMSLRILKYRLAIIEKIEKEEQINFRKTKLPTIYSIVLYTGKGKWKVETNISKYQDNYLEIEETAFTNYKLVDINDYTEEELLKEKGTIAKAMLIEKAKDKENAVKIVNKMLKQKMTKEEKKFLKRIIKTLLQNNIGEEKTKEILEKINIEEGDEDMVIENLQRIWDDTYNEGVQERKKIWNRRTEENLE